MAERETDTDSPSSLPSQRHILSCILNTIPCLNEEAAEQDGGQDVANKSTLLASQRKLLLTLHTLFPNQLLPALDLLDNHAITHVCLSKLNETRFAEEEHGGDSSVADKGGAALCLLEDCISSGVFAVKSLARVSKRSRTDSTNMNSLYLVQLMSWNCSCANFIHDAFSFSDDRTVLPDDAKLAQSLFANSSADKFSTENVLFGISESLPCCKHLLACVILVKCRQFLSAPINPWLCSREALAGLMASI